MEGADESTGLWRHPNLFFLFVVFSKKLIKNKVSRKQDSNDGSLVSETAALPTEFQPMAIHGLYLSYNSARVSIRFTKYLLM